MNILEEEEWNQHPYTLDDCVQAILFLFYYPNWDDPLNSRFPCPESDEEFANNVRISLEGGDIDGYVFGRNYGMDLKIISPCDPNDDNVKVMNVKNDENDSNATSEAGNVSVECEKELESEDVNTYNDIDNATPNTDNTIEGDQAQTNASMCIEDINKAQIATHAPIVIKVEEIENENQTGNEELASVALRSTPSQCVQLRNTESYQFLQSTKNYFIPFDNLTPNWNYVRIIFKFIIAMNRPLTRSNHNRYVENN